MDLSRLNTRVLKEPRGMIRFIQLVFALLAFTTTVSFNTQTSFTISCYQTEAESTNQYQRQTLYDVDYPFDLRNVQLLYMQYCKNNGLQSRTLDMDFSSSAQFFVATGVLCFLYTIVCLAVYICVAQLYETNPMYPVGDLLITGIFSIFWLAGASAWAANVSDLKYYTGPRYLISHLSHCNQTVAIKSVNYKYDCFPDSPGKWSTLYISLIFGFANLFLWASSMWFIYKETTFHRKNIPQPGSSYPGIMNAGTGMGVGMPNQGGVPDQYGDGGGVGGAGQASLTQPPPPPLSQIQPNTVQYGNIPQNF